MKTYNEIKLTHPKLYLLGDLHRDSDYFFNAVKSNGGIKDADIIVLGDVGLGFNYREVGLNGEVNYIPLNDVEFLQAFEEWCKGANVNLWLFRGNHDNPTLFDNTNKLFKGLNYVRCLTEGDVVVTNTDKRFLIVPGGYSIDRTSHVRIPERSYWKDEHVKYNFFKKFEAKNIYGVLAHTGPLPPSLMTDTSFIDYWKRFDKKLENDLKKERKEVDNIIKHFGVKVWYNGHYHLSEVFNHNNCDVTVIGIGELFEMKD